MTEPDYVKKYYLKLFGQILIIYTEKDKYNEEIEDKYSTIYQSKNLLKPLSAKSIEELERKLNNEIWSYFQRTTEGYDLSIAVLRKERNSLKHIQSEHNEKGIAGFEIKDESDLEMEVK